MQLPVADLTIATSCGFRHDCPDDVAVDDEMERNEMQRAAEARCYALLLGRMEDGSTRKEAEEKRENRETRWAWAGYGPVS